MAATAAVEAAAVGLYQTPATAAVVAVAVEEKEVEQAGLIR